MAIQRTPKGRIYYKPDADNDREPDTAAQQQSAPARGGLQSSDPVLGLLGQLAEKLRSSEAEREELWQEVRECRKVILDLEDKSARSEKVFIALESKISRTEKTGDDLAKKQAAVEKIQKDQAAALVAAAKNQEALFERLSEGEQQSGILAEKVIEAAAQHDRAARRMEKIVQERSRLLRKIERIEEGIVETQEALKARALVLLTDQSADARNAMAQQGMLENAGGAALAIENHGLDGRILPWWRRRVRLETTAFAALLLVAVVGGWLISEAQRPDIPQIAVLEGGGLARLNLDENRWEPVQAASGTAASAPDELSGSDLAPPPADMATAPEESAATPPAAYEDEAAMLSKFGSDPDALAAELNAIEPGDTPPAAEEKRVEREAPVEPVRQAALPPPAAAEKPAPEAAREEPAPQADREIRARIQPDASLPPAVRKIEDQAFAGVAEAQHDLGAIYTAGQAGVKQDYGRAAQWFREAGNNGIANARYNLGVLYHQGLGVPKDVGQAIEWYKKAAQLGHPEAQYNLGIAYIEGIGVKYDPKMAASYFESSASSGVIEAAYNLGLIYENGLLGSAKPEEAMLWYKITADQGNAEAKAALAQLARTMNIKLEDLDRLVAKVREQRRSEAAPAETAPRPPARAERKADAAPVDLRPGAASSAGGAVATSQAIVAQIQENLMSMGLFPGPADGVPSSQTSDAIRAYQSMQGLDITGQPTESLLVQMLAANTGR